jgi:hypothetical protein
LGPPSWTYLLRPGFWFTLAVLPPSLWALTRRGLVAGDAAARAVALPILVLGGLFALLLHEKLMNYAITIWPLAALVIAWGGTELWRRLGASWIRAVVVIVVAAIAIEGAARIATLRSRGAAATDYEQFLGRVRAYVPADALVLGQHDWWLGLSDLDYRVWVTLVFQSTPGLWTPEITIDRALGRLDPDVILIDSRMRAFLDGDPRGGAVDRWIREKDYLAAATVTDPTYGTMIIYRRER